jgi:hypothetical protein
MPNQRPGWKPPEQDTRPDPPQRKLAQPGQRDLAQGRANASAKRLRQPAKTTFLAGCAGSGQEPRIRQSRLGWKTGFEPATLGITIRCSNRLSYIHHRASLPGAPGGSRTPNRRSRSPMLYPVELRALDRNCAPGRPGPPNETRVAARNGRGRGIRTPDILLPKQARYQTALYPVGMDLERSTARALCRKAAVYHGAPRRRKGAIHGSCAIAAP